MAKRKRSHKRRRRLSGAALLSAPRRRRRSRSLTTAPRRRKRNRGMSELNLVKGKYGRIANPVIEGLIGGGAHELGNSLIPDSIFTNPSMATNEKWIRRGIGVGLAVVAAAMKQPLVAAGIAGATAAIAMKEEGILQDGPAGTFSGRSLRPARYANSRLLSDRRLLSEGGNYLQRYQGQYLYESPKDEFAY